MKVMQGVAPFKLMLHPFDALLKFVAVTALPFLCVRRFGWLDGMLLFVVVFLLGPFPPRVSVPPNGGANGPESPDGSR